MSVHEPQNSELVLVERCAEAIWQAEWTRAGNKGKRRVAWSENSDEHMDRYRFLARAAIEAYLATLRAIQSTKTGDAA